MEKPQLLITTQTSGTGSLRRIIEKLVNGKKVIDILSDPFYTAGNLSGMQSFMPKIEAHRIGFWNVPGHWNRNIDLAEFRVLLNFRDPRDMLCNQYYWALHHPSPDSPDALLSHRNSVEAQGIDEFVLGNNPIMDFDSIKYIYDNTNVENRFVISYAQLCLDFDLLLERLCSWLNLQLSIDIIARTEDERIENVASNDSFVSAIGSWQGKDFHPGRYSRELKPETVNKLNERFQGTLDFLRLIEAPHLRRFYD